MPNVKAVIIRRDSSGNMTNRVMTTPKRANLVQEGLRASDNMTMTLSAEHDVQVGDEIYYIQDYIDTTSLKAVWNFYGGFRDESGYEHDDVYTAPYTMPASVSSSLKVTESDIDWKHKGYYKFSINATSDSIGGIEITKRYKNNNVDSSGNPVASSIPVIDMSGDFDMIFEFKMLSNSSNSKYTSQTIFDNYDHATSSGKGLKVQINPSASTVTITADNGTTETIMVASSVVSYGTNVITFLRIKRQSGVFKLYFNGTEKSLTNSTNSGDLNNNKNIHLFKEYNESTSTYINNTGFTGIPIQFRFYNTVLGDDEVAKLKSSKPVNTTMKFGGKIWKVDDRGNTKKLSCSSHAKELLGTNISSNTFNSEASTTPVTVGSGKRLNNRYFNPDPTSTSGRPDMEDIVKDILRFVDGGTYAYFADEPSTNFYGDFFAEGSFLDIIKIMMTYDLTAHMFVITPRKILFINDEVQTNHVISEANYDIINSGKDDTGTTNSVFVSGRKAKYTHSQTVAFSNLQYTWSDATDLLILQNGHYVTPVVERIISVMRSNDSGATTTLTGSSGTFNITSLHNKIISLALIDGTPATSTQLTSLQEDIDDGDTNHTINGATTLIAYDASQATEILAAQNADPSNITSNTTYSTNVYQINSDNTIQFWNKTDTAATPTHNYTVTYQYSYTYYKNSSWGGTTGSGSLYWSTTQHQKYPTSIAENGLYHRNIYVPQLTTGLDIYTFINRYIIDNNAINTRQTVRTSTLVNSLTVGQKVRFSRYDKKTDTWSHTDQVVRSIEYSYPQTLTTIELGEFLFSGFDVEKQTVDSLKGLDSVSSGASRY